MTAEPICHGDRASSRLARLGLTTPTLKNPSEKWSPGIVYMCNLDIDAVRKQISSGINDAGDPLKWHFFDRRIGKHDRLRIPHGDARGIQIIPPT